MNHFNKCMVICFVCWYIHGSHLGLWAKDEYWSIDQKFYFYCFKCVILIRTRYSFFWQMFLVALLCFLSVAPIVYCWFEPWLSHVKAKKRKKKVETNLTTKGLSMEDILKLRKKGTFHKHGVLPKQQFRMSWKKKKKHNKQTSNCSDKKNNGNRGQKYYTSCEEKPQNSTRWPPKTSTGQRWRYHNASFKENF